jgi:hypothetical protein
MKARQETRKLVFDPMSKKQDRLQVREPRTTHTATTIKSLTLPAVTKTKPKEKLAARSCSREGITERKRIGANKIHGKEVKSGA